MADRHIDGKCQMRYRRNRHKPRNVMTQRKTDNGTQSNLWNTKWHCVKTSQVPSGHADNKAYQILCRYVYSFKRHHNSKSVSMDSAWQKGIHQHQDHDFLTNRSKVISKNSPFQYLMSHRLCYSQIEHASSDHSLDEAQQVLC